MIPTFERTLTQARRRTLLELDHRIGDGNAEGGAAFVLGEGDLAAMRLHKLGGDRQAEPDPPLRATLWKASNSRARAFSGTPGPVSATSMTVTEPSRRASTMISPVPSPSPSPSSACTALRQRLLNTR